MGLLTKSDRDVLHGDHDDSVTDRAINQREIRARRRIRGGITDFTEVREYLDSSNRDLIFAPAAKAETTPRELRRGLRDMVRVAYLGLRVMESAEEAERIVNHEVVMAEKRLRLEESGMMDEIDEVVDRYEQGEEPFSADDVDKLLTAGALRYRGHQIVPKTATVEVTHGDGDNKSEDVDNTEE